VDATAPAVVAAVPDHNTDSGAGRFTTELADDADGAQLPSPRPGRLPRDQR